MRTLPAAIYLDLLGTPFVEGGRSTAGMDCVGLAAEVQRRLGRRLPEFVSSEEELHRQIAQGGVLADARKIEQAEAGAIALLRMPEGHHIGTMLDGYHLLHTTRQTAGAVVERILSPLWQRRVLGYYRMEARP